VEDIIAFVGRIDLGDFDAYLVAEGTPNVSQVTEHVFKATFGWRRYPTGGALREDGQLELLFDGARVQGYLSGGELEGTIRFDAFGRVTANELTQLEELAWWTAYYAGKGGRGDNARSMHPCTKTLGTPILPPACL